MYGNVFRKVEKCENLLGNVEICMHNVEILLMRFRVKEDLRFKVYKSSNMPLSNLHNLSPYCFSSLVVPILLHESSTLLIINHQKVCNDVMLPTMVCKGPVMPVPGIIITG